MNAAADYAAQVRAALCDLPDDVGAELLEDLDEHVAVVASESDEPLVHSLGHPRDYADELRRAAGLGGPPTTPRTKLTVTDQLRRDGRRIADSAAGRSVLAFLPELRPGWWVLRAWAAVIMLGSLAAGRLSLLPFGILTPVLVAAAAVLSVRIGRWSQRQGWPHERGTVVTVLGNVVLATVAALALLGAADQNAQVVYASDGYQQPTALSRADGTPITNIHPYSGTGEALEGVLLYDQDGRAIDNLSTDAPDGQTIERLTPPGSPPAPANAFPQQQRYGYPDEGGALVGPPPVVPTRPPLGTPSPQPTDTALPSPPAAPTATVPSGLPSPTSPPTPR